MFAASTFRDEEYDLFLATVIFFNLMGSTIVCQIVYMEELHIILCCFFKTMYDL
jgi:hypothetical protein